MRLRKQTANGDLDRELRYHFERLVREYVENGMAPEEARRRARLEFGGLEQIREECHDVSGRWIEDFGKDLVYTARTLRRSPGFLAVSVLSLALGVGANTALFSVINAVMLRSLPVTEPQRLVHITRVDSDDKALHVSWQLFEYLRDHLKSISAASAEREQRPAIVIDSAEDVVDAALVSADHYQVMGLEAAAGRLLQPADDAMAPASRAAVISYGYWQRRFGLNPNAIGKTLTIEGRDTVFTIVGVTPPWYHGVVVGDDPDITLPLTMMLTADERNEPTLNNLNMIGRLAPGATRKQANAELQVLWQAWKKRVAATLPEIDRPSVLQQRAAVLSGRSGVNWLRDRYANALLLLMGIVCLILMLACANLSGVLMARAAAREREIAIRMAVGAGRARLMRQFMTESFVFAALGGSAGLLLAQWLNRILVAAMANGEAISLSTVPDWRVFVFTSSISLIACFLVGLTPSLHALRTSVNAGLRQQRAGGRQRLGRGMAIVQIAISMVLVSGAALFGTTLAKLHGVDRGMRTNNVLAFTLRTDGKCPAARCRAATMSLLDRLNHLAGVVSATAVDVLPISGSLWDRDIQVQGYTFRPGEDQTAAFNAIAPKYFATIETPLLEGREFDRRDTETSTKVAIINESFARYFFGAVSPLGRTVNSVDAKYQIVGVAADAKYTDLKQPSLRTIYIPWTQRTGEELTDFNFLVRIHGGSTMLFSATLEKVVRQTDASLRTNTVATWSSIVDRTIITERIMAALGGFFGVLALIVAGIGIFGVMAFRVSRRVNEIGVRMALGASRPGIFALVLREAGAMVLVGCLIGAVFALVLARLARAMLFEVSPADPGFYAVAALVLAIAGIGAAWLPARRAARVDPMTALRCE